MTRSSFVFALFVAAAGSALAAAPDSPTSVVDLLNRLPKLPATAEEAGTWFARDGKLAHPGLIALKADIEAHRKTVGALLESHAAGIKRKRLRRPTISRRAWRMSESTWPG